MMSHVMIEADMNCATRAEDKTNRYVAQDNIIPTDDEPSDALKGLAGRYFLRYDEGAKMFVSNVRGEYPDD